MAAFNNQFASETMQRLLNEPIRDHELISVPHTSSVLHALETMYSKDVSIVALRGTVISGNKLTGCFSARSLRGLVTSEFHHLLDDVQTFLLLHDPDALIPVALSKDVKMKEIVETMTEKSLHHMFICDASSETIENILKEKTQAIAAYHNAIESKQEAHLEKITCLGVPDPISIVSVTDVAILLNNIQKTRTLSGLFPYTNKIISTETGKKMPGKALSSSMSESMDSFQITYLVEGIAKQDLKLSLDNNIIKLQANNLSKSLKLPDMADLSKITAEHTEGALKVKIAKRSSSTAKPITVG
jgi:HSP20 family protein